MPERQIAIRTESLEIIDENGETVLLLDGEGLRSFVGNPPNQVIGDLIPVQHSSDTQSGDGAETVFQLSHDLGVVPDRATITPTSADAAGDFYVSDKTDSYVEITYTSAPGSGTDNLSWDYVVK